jgi:farnesyl diphosphate synthase
MTFNIEPFFKQCNARLENIFSAYLAEIPSSHLKEAMHYTLFNGGKRIRPLLVYATGSLFQTPLDTLDIPAAAVELMHTYSLIHDDLPGMDNADLRRGKATCHRVYGEGMAILAGDALQTLAIHIMAQHPAPLATENRLQMISLLSHATGPYGMVGGQAIDITLDNQQATATHIEQMHRLKTGALLTASVELGYLAQKNPDANTHQILKNWGECLGLAFQIQDDLLDIESATAISGKDHGLDEKNNKLTYPAVHGITRAKNKVQALYQNARESLAILGENALLLHALTDYLVLRKK